MQPRTRLIANGVLFQLGWFCCVLGGNQVALLATAAILAAHFAFFSRQRREWILIATIGVIGFSIDSALTTIGVFTFDQPLLFIPLWLCCLWLLFASTLNHALGWLKDRLILAAVLGAVSGPLSYYGGSRLADVQLSSPVWFSIIAIAVTWTILLPALMKLFQITEPRPAI